MTTVKVFFAIALGSLIGGFIDGLMGLTVGAILGYFAYEFKKTIAAVPKAFREAHDELKRWQPDRDAWMIRFEFYGYLATWIASIAGCWWVENSNWPGSHQALFSGTKTAIRFVVLMASFIGVIMTGILLPSTFGSCPSHSNNRASLSHARSCLKFGIVLFNPIPWSLAIIAATRPPVELASATVWPFLADGLVVCTILVSVYCLLRRAGTITRFCVKLAKPFLVLIHSELRLLCGIYAAAGAAIGHLSGNPFVGALIGGLLGAVSFEILSIRILKLVPATRSLFGR